MINKAAISGPVHLLGGHQGGLGQDGMPSQSTSQLPMLFRNPTTTLRPPTATGRPAAPLRTHSRFHEGSMNDRVSAVPPVNFLGPEDDDDTEMPGRDCNVPAEPLQEGAKGGAFYPRPASAGAAVTTLQKKSGGFFGSVWDGVKGTFTFGLKGGKSSRPTSVDFKSTVELDPGTKLPFAALDMKSSGDRPTRDEILNNYQQLVASGFFSSHAIQSSRHAPPPGVPPRTSSSAKTSVPYASTAPRPSTDQSPASQWPLPSSLPAGALRVSTDTSTSDAPTQHRGTKRHHAADHDEYADYGTMKTVKKLRKSASRISADLGLKKHVSATTAHSAPPTAMSNPKRGILTRRSFSSGNRETNKLAKRVLAPSSGNTKGSSVPASPILSPRRTHPQAGGDAHGAKIRGANLADAAWGDGHFVQDENSSQRGAGLTDRWSKATRPNEPLSIVPDAHRGIPRVPEIPAHFKMRRSEDQENRRWRGFRYVS